MPGNLKFSVSAHGVFNSFSEKAAQCYDLRGLLVSESFMDIYRDEYEYNKEGRVVEHRIFHPEDAQKSCSLEQFSYSDEGRLVRRVKMDENKETGASHDFIYKDGRLIEEQYRVYRENVMVSGNPFQETGSGINPPPNAEEVSGTEFLVRTLHFYDSTEGRDSRLDHINGIRHDEQGTIIEAVKYDIIVYWTGNRKADHSAAPCTFAAIERRYATEMYSFNRSTGTETEEIKTTGGKSIFRRTSRYSPAGRLIGKEEYADEEYYCPQVDWWPR